MQVPRPRFIIAQLQQGKGKQTHINLSLLFTSAEIRA